MYTVFVVELSMTMICRAFPAVHVEENGLNQSVDLMVLLTSHHAMPAATTYSETPSVIACFDHHHHILLHKRTCQTKNNIK